ncbi:unnamed protein product [Closterium sp. Naga37s-1]|nr:unnamed protein product [Closterium sp. Naga37s-1]
MTHFCVVPGLPFPLLPEFHLPVPACTESQDLSLLVLVVDVNPFFWALRPPSLPTFHDFLSQLRVFLNAYLLLHSANRAAVIATGHSCCFATAENERAKREAAAGTAEGGESAGREDGDGGTERMEGVEGNGAMDREMRDREGSQEGGVSGGREGGESGGKGLVGDQASLLSGSLSMALACECCCICFAPLTLPSLPLSL